MKTSLENIDEIFTFEGLWEVESKCGLKIIRKADKTIVIVSELYLDNPGTSVTQAVTMLPKQICDRFDIDPETLVYIEHNPDMHSKLSFYDEEFFLVTFVLENGTLIHPTYKQLTPTEIRSYIE